MKIHVRAGDQVLFSVSSRLTGHHSAPIHATVVTVNRGALTVHDAESTNGLASIFCASENGKYWYEYTNKRGDGESLDVVQLKNKEGMIVSVSAFIED